MDFIEEVNLDIDYMHLPKEQADALKKEMEDIDQLEDSADEA